MSENKIEILSVELLDKYRKIVSDIRNLSRITGIELGWHYLLDLTWIIENLGPVAGKNILDAGAGLGLLQWYLIEHGAKEVVSADRTNRSDMPLTRRARYRIRGVRSTDLAPAFQVFKKNISAGHGILKLNSAIRGLFGLLLITFPKRFKGQLLIYNQDLSFMPEIPDNSMDVVVAVSALEHNSPEGLQKVVKEIMRIIKPGGRLLATLCAGKDRDWFHEASHGWCYTDRTLLRLFDLPMGTSSNYNKYDEFFASLYNCSELRDNLAHLYFESGDNGMPWGKWDPQYQPVGICKVKPFS